MVILVPAETVKDVVVDVSDIEVPVIDTTPLMLCVSWPAVTENKSAPNTDTSPLLAWKVMLASLPVVNSSMFAEVPDVVALISELAPPVASWMWLEVREKVVSRSALKPVFQLIEESKLLPKSIPMLSTIQALLDAAQLKSHPASIDTPMLTLEPLVFVFPFRLIPAVPPGAFQVVTPVISISRPMYELPLIVVARYRILAMVFDADVEPLINSRQGAWLVTV
jgi:hypothetical protein